MIDASPAATAVTLPRKLARTVENGVRETRTFLPIFEENTPQIFAQFDKIEFT
jgi:hypothetical protein